LTGGWRGLHRSSKREDLRIRCLDQGAGSMIAIEHLTDEEFERHTLDVLQRELGLDGPARLLYLNRELAKRI
jgi:hypothetical protein